MHKKFEINWTKIKGGCQSGRKVVIHNSKSDLPLDIWGTNVIIPHNANVFYGWPSYNMFDFAAKLRFVSLIEFMYLRS